MVRFTTPTYIFHCGKDLESATEMSLKFRCKDVVVEKTIADAEINGPDVAFRLSKEETGSFKAGEVCSFRLLVTFSDGTCIPTRKFERIVEED